MKRAIKNYWPDFSAVVALMALAAIVGGYILTKQRVRLPWKPATFEMKAEFSTAQAVVPGQGQTLRVSGVRIGDVSKVDLKEGRAIVTFDVDPEYRDLIHTDATALLRPKTGLKDMFVEVDPGSDRAPLAKPGFTLPIRATEPDVNPDEIFSALDADTRDYLKLLVSGAGDGLRGRGGDLREVLARFEPTHRDIAKVAGAVAVRRKNLRRLVHNLQVLNTELAGKDDQLASLVSNSAQVFRAFASEQQGITQAVDRLPGALRQTTVTLGKVERFANVLRPAAEDLRPVVRSLDKANKAIIPFAREAAPIVRDQVRPFTREARPLARALKQPAADLAKATPKLTRSFVVLNDLFNMLGYNRDGREGPDDPNRDEGYLFWIAWLNHIGNAVFSTNDAQGSFRPVTFSSPCSIIRQNLDRPQTEFLLGLTDALLDPRICGSGAVASGRARLAKAEAKGKGR